MTGTLLSNAINEINKDHVKKKGKNKGSPITNHFDGVLSEEEKNVLIELEKYINSESNGEYKSIISTCASSYKKLKNAGNSRAEKSHLFLLTMLHMLRNAKTENGDKIFSEDNMKYKCQSDFKDSYKDSFAQDDDTIGKLMNYANWMNIIVEVIGEANNRKGLLLSVISMLLENTTYGSGGNTGSCKGKQSKAAHNRDMICHKEANIPLQSRNHARVLVDRPLSEGRLNLSLNISSNTFSLRNDIAIDVDQNQSNKYASVKIAKDKNGFIIGLVVLGVEEIMTKLPSSAQGDTLKYSFKITSSNGEDFTISDTIYPSQVMSAKRKRNSLDEQDSLKDEVNKKFKKTPSGVPCFQEFRQDEFGYTESTFSEGAAFIASQNNQSSATDAPASHPSTGNSITNPSSPNSQPCALDHCNSASLDSLIGEAVWVECLNLCQGSDGSD